MAQKEIELVDILKELDKQLTSLKTCLRSGVNVNNIVPNSPYNFLIWATHHLENEEILEYLIDSGANVNGEANLYTPLIKAVYKKSLNKVKTLISKRANVNNKTVTNKGDTPLIASIFDNNLTITEYLIEQGADVNLIGFQNRTPLSYAVEHENLQIVRLLLANRAIVNKPDGNGKTPLEEKYVAKSLRDAILKNSLIDIELLLANGTNINEVDSEGNTPLQNAILSGNIEIVKCLIKSKANVCKQGENGKTPLSTAVEIGRSDIVQLLLENGAEYTIQSALFEAIILKNLKIIKILIGKGAVLDVTYNDGSTPLTKAIETEDLDIVKILVENGANVNFPQSDGTPLNSINGEKDSPLSKAVKLGNYEIAKYFVEQGANVDQVNAEGKVPLAIAASNHDIRTVMFLIRSNARLDLAKEEIEEYMSVNDDLVVFMNSLKNGSVKNLNLPFGDFDQEAAEGAANS